MVSTLANPKSTMEQLLDLDAKTKDLLRKVNLTKPMKSNKGSNTYILHLNQIALLVYQRLQEISDSNY
jgi:hypothetical protein